jgi:4-hydroxythreonine-4-phosphate dehydrogenase
MENNKIRVGITEGDINGVGYEVILKTFADPAIFELCTPIIYGSPKVATYHRKALNLTTNFTTIESASSAYRDRLNIVNCNSDDIKVEFGKTDPEAGEASYQALEKAVDEYKSGYIDVIVTAPINKKAIHSEKFSISPVIQNISKRNLGNGSKALMILMNKDFRVALVTNHLPVKQIAPSITKELVQDKINIFNRSLKQDMGIDAPRIAVMSLNPHAGDGGVLGDEEETIISPAIHELADKGVLCYGPYAVDGFMGSGNYAHFDGILAMYHDQGLAPFKALAMDEGVNFTAGLPVIRTSPAHGTAYDIVGKGIASESSFREAIYQAVDIFRCRKRQKSYYAHPLRKQYFDKNDDSDKLKLDAPDDDLSI